MTYFQALFLAVIQGLTEFLPISSSGHLVVFQKLFGLEPPVVFDVLVHLGTLGAILFYFRKKLWKILLGIFQRNPESNRLVLLILLGTLPAAIVGCFLQNYINQIFNSLKLVAGSLMFTAGLLFSTKKIFISTKSTKTLGQMEWKDSLLIGFFQAVAILPGVSRSGSTIVAGLWRKLSQETAFYFSFYLAIPAIIGATILQIPDLINSHFNLLNQSILGMLIAGIVGYFALKMLQDILKQGKLWQFGWYCLLLVIILIII